MNRTQPIKPQASSPQAPASRDTGHPTNAYKTCTGREADHSDRKSTQADTHNACLHGWVKITPAPIYWASSVCQPLHWVIYIHYLITFPTILLVSSTSQIRKWGSERLKNSPKITQMRSVRVRTHTACPQSLCSFCDTMMPYVSIHTHMQHMNVIIMLICNVNTDDGNEDV